MHPVHHNMYSYIQFLYDISSNVPQNEYAQLAESQQYSLRERLLYFYHEKVLPAFRICTGDSHTMRLHEQLLKAFFIQEMLHNGRDKGANLRSSWHDSLSLQEIGWYIESCLKTLHYMGGSLDTTHVLDRNDYVV